MRETLLKVLLVMIGGGVGSLSRYAVSLLAVRLWGTGFAWGTLVVNLAGCFLIGLAFALAERTSFMGPMVRLFFMTGFLGGLTTFSSYALESMNFFLAGTGLSALANVFSNNLLGLGLVLLGMWAGRLI